jgi:hypothetical protein
MRYDLFLLIIPIFKHLIGYLSEATKRYVPRFKILC